MFRNFIDMTEQPSALPEFKLPLTAYIEAVARVHMETINSSLFLDTFLSVRASMTSALQSSNLLVTLQLAQRECILHMPFSFSRFLIRVCASTACMPHMQFGAPAQWRSSDMCMLKHGSTHGVH